MKKTIKLPLATSAVFSNAEISHVWITPADNEQGYKATYSLLGLEAEQDFDTLSPEQVVELAKEYGPNWEEEYNMWIGDKVYVLDSPRYPGTIQEIEAIRHEYFWTSVDENGNDLDEGIFNKDDIGVTIFTDKTSFKEALQKKYEHETEFQKQMIYDILAELYN